MVFTNFKSSGGILANISVTLGSVYPPPGPPIDIKLSLGLGIFIFVKSGIVTSAPPSIGKVIVGSGVIGGLTGPVATGPGVIKSSGGAIGCPILVLPLRPILSLIGGTIGPSGGGNHHHH